MAANSPDAELVPRASRSDGGAFERLVIQEETDV